MQKFETVKDAIQYLIDNNIEFIRWKFNTEEVVSYKIKGVGTILSGNPGYISMFINDVYEVLEDNSLKSLAVK